MPRAAVGCLLRDAFRAALSGDHARAGEILEAISRDSPEERMFGVCGGIATPAADALRVLAVPLPDPAKGEPWFVLHVRPALTVVRKGAQEEPHHLFSERFITAVLNDDRDNLTALFRAAWTAPGGHFGACVAQLFADAAGLCALAGQHLEGRSR